MDIQKGDYIKLVIDNKYTYQGYVTEVLNACFTIHDKEGVLTLFFNRITSMVKKVGEDKYVKVR